MRHVVRPPSVRLGSTSLLAIALIGASGCLGGPDDPASPPEEPLIEIGRPIAFAGHDYHFFTQIKDWVGASVVCLNLGGRLVKIDSAAEEAFLADEEFAHGGGTWWIGLNDMVSEGLLRWDPGLPVSYLNFAPGEPNNSGNQDCVYDGFTNGQWDDFNCAAQMKFICENSTIPSINEVGTFTFDVQNTNNALQNYFQFAITLDPGLRGAEVGTCGVTGSNYLGDTFIRIFNPGGQQIAFNDDSCFGNFGSNVSFMATNGQSQSYFVHVGCFQMDHCSGTVAYKK